MINERISAKDLFSVGVRIIGLLSVVRGFIDLLYALFYWTGLVYSSVASDQTAPSLRMGLIYFFVGIYLLRGAKLIVNFAYPNKLEKKSVAKTVDTSTVQN